MAGYLGIEASDEKPYIFISYNSEDQKRLYSIAQMLQKYRINIWYDNGIQRISKEEWQEQIALHIRNAEIIFIFISHGIFLKEDSFVRKEYDVAARLDKNICVVLMDEIDASGIPAKYDFWWDEIIHKQCIDAVNMSNDEIAKAIYTECNVVGAVKVEEYGYDEKYCYKNSIVLKNKMNIIDEYELAVTIDTMIKPVVKQLVERPLKGIFDYEYLRKLHKKLYGQIFDWAGHTRTVNISDQVEYCYCNYIISQTEELFEKLRKEKYLQQCSDDQKYSRLAYYLGELNAIHPFRYGNQVVQEVFISILGKKVGCNLNFDGADRDKLTQAYIRAYNGDYDLLEDELKRIDLHLTKIDPKNFKYPLY